MQPENELLTLWNQGWSANAIARHLKQTQAVTQGRLQRMRERGVEMRRGAVSQSKLNKEHEIAGN